MSADAGPPRSPAKWTKGVIPRAARRILLQTACRVDLLEAADRPVRGYSKGMLQRTGLAQALLNDPVLVFLDEPTSGLDPLGRLLVRDIISELRDAARRCFYNSHLLGEVEATCDRVAFVKQGRTIHEMGLGQSVDFIDLEESVRLSVPARRAVGIAVSQSTADIGGCAANRRRLCRR